MRSTAPILREIWLWGPPVTFAGLLFVMSHQPVLAPLPTSDKLVHVVAYAVLGALLARALQGSTPWSWGYVFQSAALWATLYGISDELHQSFVPGRDASVGDVVADAAGSLLGAALGVTVYAWVRGRGSFASSGSHDTAAQCPPPVGSEPPL